MYNFPYPTDFSEKHDPSLAALPYIAAAQGVYAARLSGLLTEGRVYSLSDLRINIHNTNQFVTNVIKARLQDAVDIRNNKLFTVDELIAVADAKKLPIAESARRVIQRYNYVAEYLTEMYEQYKAHPNALNKQRGQQTETDISKHAYISKHVGILSKVLNIETEDLIEIIRSKPSGEYLFSEFDMSPEE